MNKKLFFTLTGAIACASAWATPTLYPRDPNLIQSVENRTNSNLLADDDSDEVFWVMPPNDAYSKVGNLHTISASTRFCQEIADLVDYSRDMSREMKNLSNRKIEMFEEIEQIDAKIARADQELSKYVVDKNLESLRDMSDRLTEVESMMDALRSDLRSCDNDCDALERRWNDLRSEQRDLQNSVSFFRRQHIRDVKVMDRKKASLNAFKDEKARLSEKYGTILRSLTEMRDMYQSMFGKFSTVEAARASVSYTSTWEQNVDALRQANPRFKFQQIPTQNAVVYFEPLDNPLSSWRDILSIDMGGPKVNGGISFPSYPANFQANIRLSLLGACPILNPSLFPNETGQASTTEKMNYGVIVSYDFPSSFQADVSVTYNMYKMVEKIVKSKTKGGFFKTYKHNTSFQRDFFREHFTTKWTEQDPANSLSSEEKSALEDDIRNQLFARLAAVGLPSVPNPGVLIAEGTNPSGAAVLGRSLANNKACQLNKWCMAATIGVEVLDAMFSSSESTTSFKHIQDVEQTQSWARKQVIMKPWISSYH